MAHQPQKDLHRLNARKFDVVSGQVIVPYRQPVGKTAFFQVKIASGNVITMLGMLSSGASSKCASRG